MLQPYAISHWGAQTVDGVNLKGLQCIWKFSKYLIKIRICCYSVSMSDSLWPHGLQYAKLPLSITNSQSLPRLMSIESVIPSNHCILCRPLLLPPSIFPSIRIFSSESALHIRWPSIGVSASTSVLPMNTQDWSPLGWTGWISLQSKGLARVFSNTTVQKHQFFSAQLSLCTTFTSIHDYWKNHSFD